MESLEPFGEGNEKPVFLIKDLKTKGQPIAVKRNGLKFFVTDGKTSQDVITFDPEYGSYISELDEIDLVFTPEVDNWMGRKTMSLKFIDGRKCAKSDLFK